MRIHSCQASTTTSDDGIGSSRVPTSAIERIVDLARLAPSIHNTQPWDWRVRGGALELWADRTRGLPATDPEGRNLVISCGSALHHARAAAEALALEPFVELLPETRSPDLLARIWLHPAGSRRGVELIEAIGSRRTDRRRFTSWPVPVERVAKVASAASSWGAEGVPLTDAPLRHRVELMLERARLEEAHDADVLAETELWLDHSDTDGVPHETIPEVGTRPGEHPHRFAGAPFLAGLDEVLRPSDGLVVIATSRDDPLCWLGAGQALSALWLRATLEGLSVVPLSQVVEYVPTRELLRTELSVRRPEPQVLVRLGWQEISRSRLPRTPRRPLGEVLSWR